MVGGVAEKNTQVRKSIDECDSKDIVYVSLFGIKSTNEISNCYNHIGSIGKTLGNLASIGCSRRFLRATTIHWHIVLICIYCYLS